MRPARKRDQVDCTIRLEDALERGDHSGRAVPALGTVMVDHRLLDRAETLGGASGLRS